MDDLHRTSDEQSLRLTQAALDLILKEPALAAKALKTLDHWDTVAPEGSASLRRTWRTMLSCLDFRGALATDEFGQQLRQASPLAGILPPARRLAIIRACKGRSSNT